jgi:hypothetical protein
VIVHLLDGTYELFRQHFGRPDPGDYGATKAVLSNTLGMLADGVTHLGVASDHIIESFRNDLWPGYKTSAGMPPELVAQFPVMEGAMAAMGVTVWPMVEWEADDALASAAAVADADVRVERVVICTPDKDLGQCVRGTRVVQLDRRKNIVFDEDGVIAKFGVRPESIPDYLALVGDSADGYPGLPVGGPRARRRCCPGTGISRTSPIAPVNGTCRGCATPPSSPRPSLKSASSPCSSGASPPPSSMCLLAQSTSGSGRDLPTRSPRSPSASMLPTSSNGPPHWPRTADSRPTYQRLVRRHSGNNPRACDVVRV